MQSGAMLVLEWDGERLVVMAEKDGRLYRAALEPMDPEAVESFDAAYHDSCLTPKP